MGRLREFIRRQYPEQSPLSGIMITVCTETGSLIHDTIEGGPTQEAGVGTSEELVDQPSEENPS